MMCEPIAGQELYKQLVEKGIVPDQCRRVIIDITIRKPIMIYCELYTSKKILELNLPDHLEDAVKINVSEKTAESEVT